MSGIEFLRGGGRTCRKVGITEWSQRRHVDRLANEEGALTRDSNRLKAKLAYRQFT
jgi:hypothetical protein